MKKKRRNSTSSSIELPLQSAPRDKMAQNVTKMMSFWVNKLLFAHLWVRVDMACDNLPSAFSSKRVSEKQAGQRPWVLSCSHSWQCQMPLWWCGWELMDLCQWLATANVRHGCACGSGPLVSGSAPSGCYCLWFMAAHMGG